MFQKRLICLLVVLACLCAVALPGIAAEVSSDAVYCFTGSDFSPDEEPLVGVCIMELPEAQTGTIMLGTRIIQPGDILTAEQLAQMTFRPVRSTEDACATVGYLPIYENRVEDTAILTISIRGKQDKAPTAKDVNLETYKNIPNEGRLKATDPEGQPLSYTLTRQPRRGDVVIQSDGTFTYTPKKNKVGVDSFTYTATDPSGNVSKEATVTIKILKPADAAQYEDTVGLDCQFEAEWLKQTGLFSGEQVGGKLHFQPEKPVSKGEFTALLLESLNVPVEKQSAYTGLAQDAPDWLKPYLAAAVRSGLLTGVADSFAFDQPISQTEAAIMLQNALDLEVVQTIATEDEPSNAELALAVMNEHGFVLAADAVLTRAECAKLLYQLSITNAPGKAVFAQQN